MTDMIRFKPRQPKRPYRVAKIGGGTRSFASIVSATEFAGRQAAASWTDRFWTIRKTSDGGPDRFLTVDRSGQIVNPANGEPV